MCRSITTPHPTEMARKAPARRPAAASTGRAHEACDRVERESNGGATYVPTAKRFYTCAARPRCSRLSHSPRSAPCRFLPAGSETTTGVRGRRCSDRHPSWAAGLDTAFADSHRRTAAPQALEPQLTMQVLGNPRVPCRGVVFARIDLGRQEHDP